jgi:hypothetical protein
MKSKLLKHIDELEQKFITKLTSIKEKNETKIKKEKDELSRLVSCLKDEKTSRGKTFLQELWRSGMHALQQTSSC